MNGVYSDFFLVRGWRTYLRRQQVNLLPPHLIEIKSRVRPRGWEWFCWIDIILLDREFIRSESIEGPHGDVVRVCISESEKKHPIKRVLKQESNLKKRMSE